MRKKWWASFTVEVEVSVNAVRHRIGPIGAYKSSFSSYSDEQSFLSFFFFFFRLIGDEILNFRQSKYGALLQQGRHRRRQRGLLRQPPPADPRIGIADAVRFRERGGAHAGAFFHGQPMAEPLPSRHRALAVPGEDPGEEIPVAAAPAVAGEAHHVGVPETAACRAAL